MLIFWIPPPFSRGSVQSGEPCQQEAWGQRECNTWLWSMIGMRQGSDHWHPQRIHTKPPSGELSRTQPLQNRKPEISVRSSVHRHLASKLQMIHVFSCIFVVRTKFCYCVTEPDLSLVNNKFYCACGMKSRFLSHLVFMNGCSCSKLCKMIALWLSCDYTLSMRSQEIA